MDKHDRVAREIVTKCVGNADEPETPIVRRDPSAGVRQRGSMKLAKEIREQLVRPPTHLDGSGYACITDSAGNIHVPPDVIESIIAAKLEPVKAGLSNIRHDLAAVLSEIRNADVPSEDAECRTIESLERVRKILAMLSEEES